MNTLNLAYVAGLVDGEGWIGFAKHPSKNARLGYNFQPTVSIVMRNNDYILKSIAENYHGYFGIHGRREMRPNEKPIGLCLMQWRAVPNFLRDIVPYLHCKKKQAELMLEYFEETYPIIKGQNGRFLGDDKLLKKIDYYNKFKILNARGKKNPAQLLDVTLLPPKPTLPPEWKPIFTKEELTDLYITKELSDEEISQIKDCSHSTVQSYRKQFDIKGRSKSESAKKRLHGSRGRFLKVKRVDAPATEDRVKALLETKQ